ncbi:nucleotide-diphospho-sugar transferase, partial [Thamnocephalis sphaerospora]
ALTEEENLPKALLPVANRPMIAHVMSWLQRCGIHDITVVTPASTASKVSHVVRAAAEDATGVEVVASDECQGSADALRLVRDRIKNNVLVIGCDFITELDPNRFLDSYRMNKDAAVTCIFYEQADAATAKADDFTRFVGITPDQRLVQLTSAEASHSELDVRASLLWKFPRVRMHANLLDGHAYILNRWVLDYLTARPRIVSLREDLLPALVKMQWKRGRMEREGVLDCKCLQHSFEQAVDNANDKDTIDDSTALALSTTQLAINQHTPEIRCRVLVCRADTCVTGRANTVPAYCELNRNAGVSTVSRVHASAEVDPKTQIGPDSMVGESTRMEERCSVKRSVIGAHCQIGKNVKIVNSILMDGVSLGDNVKLDGCVICQNVKVQERSSLKDTVVGAQVTVPAESESPTACASVRPHLLTHMRSRCLARCSTCSE